MIARAFRLFRADLRCYGRLFRPFPLRLSDPLQRRDSLPGDRLQLFLERLRIVGDEFRPIPRPTDFHIEALLVRHMGMRRLHRGDHVVHGPALKRVHGRGPGVVEMAQLRIATAQFQCLSVLQLVNARYEKGAMILTPNKGFAEWGDMFGDPVMATALLDRLLHHATVVHIEGASYRLREHADLIPEHVRANSPIAPPPPPRHRGRPPKAKGVN